MRINSKLFDVMKWIVMVCIPAFTTAFVGLDSAFGWGYGEIVAKISAIICSLLGTLLGLSSITYYKEQNLPDEGDEEANG